MTDATNKGFFSNIKKGLFKTSSKLSDGIKKIFSSGKKVDQETLEELKELLITADVGYDNASLLTQKLASTKFNEMDDNTVKQKLAESIENILLQVEKPLSINNKPHVIMVCGTNGNGKTTTIGKLAHRFKNTGKKVLVAACDTFRAAATEQLIVWSQKVNFPVVTGNQGADAASIAYQAMQQALNEQTDVLLIDTAGRLHNHKNLMEELAKIRRIINKHDNNAPHDVILILDATTGQNAVNQVDAFLQFVNISGLIITKLDGTAKGGVVIRIAQKYKLNIHAIGIGESVEQLQDFSAKEFAAGLLDINTI
ncbi:signal recognition particle-docking protein FtsY [Ehrlichia chaffeensis str. Heartland]|uniref:Signal recognition particle-docking protein FtsY n=1 Tax=Ehrlichia chaffeensis (strain ATCC CRL-10679 / Arkansas) TaxID=205920 RepID=Q2GF88_EHRCR|nr:signal recognition particle-docking protein FtsY [Ehrlichia chaffeensis]ABD44615.1 signal recognition particle-docking protein FtsY [Ehrlichia chaffeensis str. Arkansas]AHX03247.1 signal recognition particle-docking protein FtsY [Ehrlichia chaffeensis str. Heartland]AHX05163.1 signal recognition particle-docking protein FtsY [Ehrlichia chaffeensis str. Jax]AHX06152.1 signal recognition particle-docking protein FtsY [Ehrlichia chaffeensis str. Liberty]AHX07148.1 signal recognition particle-d